MKDKETRTMLHEHQKKDNDRYEADKNRLDKLEKRDKSVRTRDAIIGTLLILMSIGWNKIASICEKIPFISFSYNEGWGLAQGSMLLVGTGFIVWAIWRLK